MFGTSIRNRSWVLASIFASGCFSIDLPERIACDDGVCPSGQVCSTDGFCSRPGQGADPDDDSEADGDATPAPSASCPDAGCEVDHGWSHSFGSTATDRGLALALDDTRLYLAGFYTTNAVDFGGGALTNDGLHDAMVVTFDLDGMHRQSLGFGGTGHDESHGITIDADGNVLLTGESGDDADFGGGPLPDFGGRDIFLARLSDTGVNQGQRNFGGIGDDGGDSVSLDAEGNVFVAGYFSGAATLADGGHTSSGETDLFLSSFSPGGDHRWTVQLGGTGLDSIAGLSAHDATGVVCLSGSFAGSIELGVDTIASKGEQDGFVICLDSSSGGHRWHSVWGGPLDDDCNGIIHDPDGNLYAAADFRGTATFGDTTIASLGGEDITLLSFSPNGEKRWERHYGGPGDDDVARLAFHGDKLVIAGVLEGTLDLGDTTLTSNGGEDALVMALTSAGQTLWARGFGGSGDDEANALAVDQAGRVYVTGAYSERASFGGAFFDSAGQHDIFMARLDPLYLDD